MRVGAVVAVSVVLAGRERETDTVGAGVWGGECPAAADRRRRPVVGKAVVVAAVGVEFAVEVDFHRVVVVREPVGRDAPRPHDVRERRVGGDGQRERGSGSVGVGRDAGPADRPGVRRGTAGDALGEHGRIGHAVSLCGRRRERRRVLSPSDRRPGEHRRERSREDGPPPPVHVVCRGHTRARGGSDKVTGAENRRRARLDAGHWVRCQPRRCGIRYHIPIPINI
jgi:hypothetical protein